MSTAEALRACDLFQSLSDDEIASVGEFSREQTLETGMTLYIQGMEAECLYVLAEGRIKISKLLWEGREETMGQLGPGDSFGEIGQEDVPAAVAVRDEGDLVAGRRGPGRVIVRRREAREWF